MWDDMNEAVEVGGLGPVDVHFFSMRVCTARVAGWVWFGDGHDDGAARNHLLQRLEARNPLFGGIDYGRFGQPVEDLGDADLSFFSEETLRKLASYLTEVETPPSP